MNARRFDLFARGIAHTGTRRSILRSLAIVVGGTAAGSSSARALDATSEGVGGTDATGACPPSRSPTRSVAGTPPFPAFLVGGSCADLDDSIIYNLIDAGAEESGIDPRGSSAAVACLRSLTTIRVPLEDLLDDPHAIVVRAGGTGDDEIACGEIGGVLLDDTLALGLRERNGSGYAGTAHLSILDGQTRVNILLAQDLFELIDSWEGQVVITTIDLNLRSEPSEDSEIIAVLGEGAVLTVTGPAEGEWLPVVNDATGDAGYVSSTFVVIQ